METVCETERKENIKSKKNLIRNFSPLLVLLLKGSDTSGQPHNSWPILVQEPNLPRQEVSAVSALFAETEERKPPPTNPYNILKEHHQKAAWCGNCTISDCNTLQWIVRAAEKDIDSPLPPLKDIDEACNYNRASNIVKKRCTDSSLFHHLACGIMLQWFWFYKTNSFILQAVRTLNSHTCLVPARPSVFQWITSLYTLITHWTFISTFGLLFMASTDTHVL